MAFFDTANTLKLKSLGNGNLKVYCFVGVGCRWAPRSNSGRGTRGFFTRRFCNKRKRAVNGHTTASASQSLSSSVLDGLGGPEGGIGVNLFQEDVTPRGDSHPFLYSSCCRSG